VQKGGLRYPKYPDLAKALLPDWFHAALPAQAKPGEWTTTEWEAIEDGLKRLIDESNLLNIDPSNYKVDWPTVIRPLGDWKKEAQRMARRDPWMAEREPSNERPVEIFSKRLRKIMEK
jgi:hypothetical protein